MRSLLPVVWLAAVASLGVGCISYPVVRPDAFQPTRKLAIVLFDSEPIAGGLMGIPIAMDVTKPYEEFLKNAEESDRFELIPTSAIQKSGIYASLPPPLIDIGSSAPGLRRVILSPSVVPDLAREIGADIVVLVHHSPEVETGVQVMGIGSSVVNVTTRLVAYAANGQEVWRDVIRIDSESFPSVGGIRDPNVVQNNAVKVSRLAATQLIPRLLAKLDTAAAAPR